MSHVVDEKRGLSGGERTRRMRRAGFSAAVGRTVTMMVALVATPLLVSALGTSGYGIYATVTSLSAFMALGQLGLGSGLLTVMAARQGEGDESEVRAVAQSAWLLAAGSAILVALLGWCVSLVFDIPALLGAPPALTTSALVSFRIYVIGFAVVMVLGLCGRFQAALQRGSEAALWLAGSAVASMVLGAAMATVSGSIPLAVLGTVTGQFMALGAQTVRFLWQEPLLRPSVTLGGGHAVLLRASGWLLVLEVSAALAFQTDLFVVSALLGSDQAAVYQVTLRLFGLLGLVTAALATQYWPAAAEALAARDPQWVRESLRQTVIVLTGATAVTSAILVIVGQNLMKVWVGPELVAPLPLLVAMAIWFVYSAALLPFSYLLNAAGVLRIPAILAVAMAAANLLVSLALTSVIGLPGPVVGSLLAHAFVSGVPTVVLSRAVLRHSGEHDSGL